MKPITLESIRNLLRSKKKNKEKGIDSSFKRSDSFKRISIRKSYLERGRKRNLRQKAAVISSLDEIEINLQDQRRLESTPVENHVRKNVGEPQKTSLQKINEMLYPDEIKRHEVVEVVSRKPIAKPPRPSLEQSKGSKMKSVSTVTSTPKEKVITQIKIDIGKPPPTSIPLLSSRDNEQYSYETESCSFSINTFVNDELEHETQGNLFEVITVDEKTTDLPSLVTFKTYCKTENNYLETSFDSNHEPSTVNNSSSTTATTTNFTTNHCLDSSRSNITRTSLNYEPSMLVKQRLEKKPPPVVIDSSTFKLDRKNRNKKIHYHNDHNDGVDDAVVDDGDNNDDGSRERFQEGIVIKIPAIDHLIDNDYRHHRNNDEVVNCDDDYDDVDDHDDGDGNYNDDRINKGRLKLKLSNDSALDVPPDYDDEIVVDEATLNAKCTFQIYKALTGREEKIQLKVTNVERNDPGTDGVDQDHEHIIDNDDDEDGTKNDSSVLIKQDFFDEEDFYDNSDVISPDDSSIPYGLRLKENPFTRQKEPYSINLGRIWKQLNIGQEEDLSLPATSTSAILHQKNESFKSMSSRDSGFSVTLTKPSKNLFRKKSKKNYIFRHKPNFTRDGGHFKKVMVVQRNSTQRKKKSKSKSKKKNDDETNFENLYGKWKKSTNSIRTNHDLDLHEFEAFCNRRNKENIEFYRNQKLENDKFSEELNDLEYIYEQHLKRLKHFFDERKKLNETKMNEICRTYDDNEFTFPRPDKRTNTTGKKKGHQQPQSTFLEVRTFSRENTLKTDYDRDRDDDFYYTNAELYFACKEFLDFPYSKLTQYKSHRRKKKTRRKVGNVYEEIETKAVSNPLPSQPISLEDYFPSINQPTIVRDPLTCHKCCKVKKQNRLDDDDDDDEYDDVYFESDDFVDDNDDGDDGDGENDEEFSEHEFLAASIGDFEFCEKCDRTLGDCGCHKKVTSVYCKCDLLMGGVNGCHFKGAAMQKKKKLVQRRKSRRKVKKHNSTLGRGYKCGDITQKGYEKKRARLLQPFITKNSQGDGYYNLQNQSPGNAISGGGGGGHGGVVSGGGGVPPVMNVDGYSYAYDVASLQGSHHSHSGGQKSSSGSKQHQHQMPPHQNRTRRTQRRVTHNEKRYHSVGDQRPADRHGAQFLVQHKNIIKSSYLKSQTTSATSQSQQQQQQQHIQMQQLQIHQQQQIVNELSQNLSSLANLVPSPTNQSSTSSNLVFNSKLSTNITATPTTTPSMLPTAPLPVAVSASIQTTTPTKINSNNNQQPSKNRRLGRHESRYTSEVRQEAVQQALAALKNRPKPSLPMPSKRSSVLNRSPDRDRDDSDTTSDDGSIPEERIATPDSEYNLARDHITSREQLKLYAREHPSAGHLKNLDRRPPQNFPTQPPLSDTSSAGSSPPAVHRNIKNSSYDMTDISDLQNVRPYVAPDVTQFSQNTRRVADRVTRYASLTGSEPGDTGTAGRWKVSAKIQQLLNTLKRPKRRPLPEFYEDNDIELEIAANQKDPNAPKPEGNTMTPVVGEQLKLSTGLPRTLEAAVQKYGSSSLKLPMATVLDTNGKMTTTLTYAKLLSRATKIAYALSTKTFSKGPEQVTLKPGDKVALVYPNSDPLNFITAWYGCMFRGLIPLPIELPLSSSDSPPQQIGFLLSSCGIQVALTSEACLKGLPKSSTGEIAKLKGWPRLHWFVTEHLPKPPKDFSLNNLRIQDVTSAYIEYTSDKEGSVMGVTVTRQAMMSHCRALTMACHYTEGETTVCVLDFKREVGLWHAVLTSVMNGMHVLFIPYALMKLRPSSWMQLITKYRASCCLVKSRDLHWGLLATKDHKDISLSSLRMLLVADGANPWSLSSCDQFLKVFQAKGLRDDAIWPCASSSEAFTVSLRRLGRGYSQSAPARGVLSMAALSHGVVRVDSENSLTSLTLQDCGQVMPATTMVVIRSEGPPVLCKTDQVGEICVTAGSTGTSYYGLDGMTNATFKVQPILNDDECVDGQPPKPINDDHYVRSGLLGFIGPGGLVFVCGSREGLMTVSGRKHNADDIIATVLAVEPSRFIYRGRISVFSIKVLRDERVCVIAEQRPDCSEDESYQWMSRVLQAVDSIHQVGIYCLALVPPNHLPKTPLGGINLCEARRRFLEGSLHPINVLMCPHTCVTNLPKPREIHQGALQQPQVSVGTSSSTITETSVGPASVMVGNLVQGNRLAIAQGRDIGLSDDNEKKHQLITGVLRWRANTSPDHVLYTMLNSKGAVSKTLTCSELHKRAEKIAALLQERGKINPGDHVALIFPPGIDLICAFYGCLYIGAIPVTIRPPHPQNLITTLPTVRMIVDVSKSGIILSIQSIIKLLKTREAAASIDPKSWPTILDIDDNPKRKLAAIANSTLDSTAFLDFSVSTSGRLSGVIITHRSLSSLCASLKLACELYPSRHVALCLDPYCGLGFAMWTLIGVYSGHHSILIAPYEVETNPSLWLSTLSQYRVRDTFCSYGVIELCTKALSNSIQMLKQRNVNLACVRTCVVVAEERPRVQLTQQFCKLFQALGLNTRCVSTSFGCRVNPAICVQGASSAESAQVYVDLRALRNNRVALVERGAPNSICLIESGKLLPGVKAIIANPDTKGHCSDSHLGEIWVQSPHNADGYFIILGDDLDYNDHFNAKLVTGATNETWARTGYLGFLRRTECSQSGSILDETTPSIASRDSDTESLHSSHNISATNTSTVSGGGGTGPPEQELHDAVYVVGALDEVSTLRGLNYHAIDIENSVLRCHKKIAECAVFQWPHNNLLVVVVELDGNESEALDLVPLVTNTVLEDHQLIVGVVVVVDPGVVPINSRGEKQRMHLRDGFMADQLEPIYVAYNM